MIKLFVTDIDGCLLDPMKTPDWALLSQIKALNEQSKHHPVIPSLTLCTGRPMPYAEAIAQIMGITLPIVFESAGVFHPDTYGVSVDNSFDKRAADKVYELKRWLKKNIIPKFKGMTAEFSKMMDAGVIHPQQEIIQQALPVVQNFVEENHPNFEVHHTHVSINIILKNNNKKTGIEKLCQLLDVLPEEVAFIGDSSGDIPGLRLVGQAFAPQNATEEVKRMSTVMTSSSTQAVLEAIRQVVETNQQ